MKKFVMILGFSTASLFAFAQDDDTPTTAATQSAQSYTTAAIAEKYFSDEMFERQWQNEEQLYRSADIPDGKISTLHDLKKKQWQARRSGERVNYSQLVREVSQVLSPEELQRVTSQRTDRIRQVLADGATSASMLSTGTRRTTTVPTLNEATTATIEQNAGANTADNSTTGSAATE